jgi:hypothetical protein
MEKHRIGQFYIGTQLFDKELKLIQRVLAKVVVLRAELTWDKRSVEYTALSDNFESVDKGSVPPLYHAKCEARENCCTKITFERDVIGCPPIANAGRYLG